MPVAAASAASAAGSPMTATRGPRLRPGPQTGLGGLAIAHSRAARREAAPWLRDHQGPGGALEGLLHSEPRHGLSGPHLPRGDRACDRRERGHSEALSLDRSRARLPRGASRGNRRPARPIQPRRRAPRASAAHHARLARARRGGRPGWRPRLEAADSRTACAQVGARREVECLIRGAGAGCADPDAGGAGDRRGRSHRSPRSSSM